MLPLPAGEGRGEGEGDPSPAPPSAGQSAQQGRQGRAFTFVEVLIGTLCLAIILAALNSTFYAAMRLRNRTTQRLEENVPLSQALAIMRRDLQGIMVPSTNSTGSVSGPLTTTPQNLLANLPAGPNGVLQFTTSTGVLLDNPFKPVPWGDAQQVAYYLKPPEVLGATRGMDLVRGVMRNVMPILTNITDLTETHLLSGIDTMRFYFWDGTNWQNTWDSPTLSQLGYAPLPQVVKVTLNFATYQNGQPVQGPMNLEVPILVQGRTNQNASASSSTSSTSSGGGTTGGSSTGGRSTGGGATGGGGAGGGGRSSGGPTTR